MTNTILAGGALGQLLQSGEGNYGSYNRGNAGDSHGALIDFSQMTLAELQSRQSLPKGDPNRIFAFGKYQIIPGTLSGAVSKLKLNGTELMTPELQERIFSDYLISIKRPSVNDYITGKISGDNGLHLALQQVAMEWASVADPDTNLSRYGGSGNNKASLTVDQVTAALDTMRTQYLENTANHMPPKEAFAFITGRVVQPASISTSVVSYYSDGSTTYESTITADKATALLEAGASFNQTYNANGSLSSSVIYHQNGITESTDISADGTVSSYAKWENGKLVTLVSTNVATNTVVGEFVLGGQRYNADGTPVVAAGSTAPVPASIDPSTVSAVTIPSLSQADAQSTTSAALANAGYTLSIQTLPSVQDLLPNATSYLLPTGNADTIISNLQAQGYTVTQTEDSISAYKDDGSYFSTDGTSIEIGGNGFNAKFDANNFQVTRSQQQANGTIVVDAFDAVSHEQLSTGIIEYIGQYDASIQTTQYTDGHSSVITTDEAGSVIERQETTLTPSGTQTKTYDGANSLVNTVIVIHTAAGDITQTITVIPNIGSTEVTQAPDGTVTANAYIMPMRFYQVQLHNALLMVMV